MNFYHENKFLPPVFFRINFGMNFEKKICKDWRKIFESLRIRLVKKSLRFFDESAFFASLVDDLILLILAKKFLVG